MTSRALLAALTALAAGTLVAAGPPPARAQMPSSPPSLSRPGPAHEHGTPAGWRFTWPRGDPTRGREAFVRLECYSCHEVLGESLPKPSDSGRVGPELSRMAPLHDPEYFAEAIVNPSAVIEPDRGYSAADGSSRMPSYNDSITVQEVADLVAYLRGLKPPGPGGTGGHGDHTTR